MLPAPALSSIRRLPSVISRQVGATLVELAIVLPLLLSVGFLLLDAARWHWTRQIVHQALLDATRTAAASGIDQQAIESQWQYGLSALPQIPTLARWNLVAPNPVMAQMHARLISHGRFRGAIGLDPAWMVDRATQSPHGQVTHQQAHNLELAGIVSFQAMTPGVSTALRALARTVPPTEARFEAWSQGQWLIALRVSSPLQSPAPLQHVQAAYARQEQLPIEAPLWPVVVSNPIGAISRQSPTTRAWWSITTAESPEASTSTSYSNQIHPAGLDHASPGSQTLPKSELTQAASPSLDSSHPECGVTLCCGT